MRDIEHIIASPGKTLLCLGPLSTNIVEAAAEISERTNVPLVLIASRRQVDAASLGSGYVNGWSTEQFAIDIRAIKKGNLYLARDHGGPGQGNFEKNQNIPVSDWMKIAKESYLVDIESGLDFLHLDPSLLLAGQNYSTEKSLEYVLELYGFVQEYANSRNHSLRIEVGTEEHTGLAPDLEFLHFFLAGIDRFCRKQKFKMPLFVVSQTGTRVEELQNVGVFESSNYLAKTEITRLISEAAKVCATYGCYLKEHNADYLSTQNLTMRPHIGIKAANVAPEFGVVETKSLLHLMRLLRCNRELDEFQRIVLDSGHWKKWLSLNSRSSDLDRVLMAGHYSFNHPSVKEIKNRVADLALRKNIILNDYLRQNIAAAISRYVAAFGLSGQA